MFLNECTPLKIYSTVRTVQDQSEIRKNSIAHNTYLYRLINIKLVGIKNLIVKESYHFIISNFP